MDCGKLPKYHNSDLCWKCSRDFKVRIIRHKPPKPRYRCVTYRTAQKLRETRRGPQGPPKLPSGRYLRRKSVERVVTDGLLAQFSQQSQRLLLHGGLIARPKPDEVADKVLDLAARMKEREVQASDRRTMAA
jgi:hypothetical protein